MPEPFDKKEYLKHATYHQCLLFASFLFLPRSGNTSAVQTVSLDRPEHPFLTPITSSPIRTMLFYLMGAVICSILWGQHLRTWAEGSLRSKVREERVKKTVKRIQDGLLATLIAIPCVFILLYLLGAPWYKSFETLLLSTQFALLVVWPAVQALGLPSLDTKGFAHRYRYTRLFCSLSPETPVERVMVNTSIGAVLGTWIGAILLALDWDRPWQLYPLTPAFGMLVGYAIGGYVI